MNYPLCTLVNPDTVWSEGVEEQRVFILWGRYGNDPVEVDDKGGFFTLNKELCNVSWTDVSAIHRINVLHSYQLYSFRHHS